MNARRPVALVTGGRRGIGLAVATRLARDGFDLYIADVAPDTEGSAEALRRHGATVTYLQGDLGDLSSHRVWLDVVRAGAGRIDCVVNNAGMGAVARGDVLGLTPENFDRVMAVNLRGTAFLTLDVLRLMLTQPAGPAPRTVVNITSVSASHVSEERLDYCVSKAALAMWSKGLAVRFARDGIAVFDVRPGIIRSDMTAPVAAKYDRLIADGLVPASRWGEGDDVADVVSALASGSFAYATGSVIEVGGGLHIGRL
jgi:3-oxoacyl-[acyl-carrier protein] reductase